MAADAPFVSFAGVHGSSDRGYRLEVAGVTVLERVVTRGQKRKLDRIAARITEALLRREHRFEAQAKELEQLRAERGRFRVLLDKAEEAGTVDREVVLLANRLGLTGYDATHPMLQLDLLEVHDRKLQLKVGRLLCRVATVNPVGPGAVEVDLAVVGWLGEDAPDGVVSHGVSRAELRRPLPDGQGGLSVPPRVARGLGLGDATIEIGGDFEPLEIASFDGSPEVIAVETPLGALLAGLSRAGIDYDPGRLNTDRDYYEAMQLQLLQARQRENDAFAEARARFDGLPEEVG